METLLFQSGDAVTRTKLYLRILYAKDYLSHARALSEAPPGELPELTHRLLASIDFDIMELEQAARRRNLGRHIFRAAPALQHALTSELFGDLIADYTNSAAFWLPSGRSLAENFCLFAHQETGSRLTTYQKATVKGCGIVAGISVAGGEDSPWAALAEASNIGDDEGSFCETFLSSSTLVDEGGEFATGANLRTVQAEVPSRIFIRRLANHRVIAHSVPL